MEDNISQICTKRGILFICGIHPRSYPHSGVLTLFSLVPVHPYPSLPIPPPRRYHFHLLDSSLSFAPFLEVPQPSRDVPTRYPHYVHLHGPTSLVFVFIISIFDNYFFFPHLRHGFPTLYPFFPSYSTTLFASFHTTPCSIDLFIPISIFRSCLDQPTHTPPTFECLV